jgi:L-lactate dehydrogenase complex protein LldE
VRLAKRYAEVFAGYDAVVTPSGSCAAMIREHHRSEAAERTYDLSEFLVDVLGVTDVGAYFPHRVTYHPTCHSLRLLHLGDRPRKLLENVRGLELLPLPGAEECCGFGGTFAMKNPDISAAMCGDKVRNIASTGAEVVCAADNSCLMHIGGTLTRQKLGVRAVHLAEILAATEAGR